MHHNIVLIDDNFAIRQIIKIFLTRLSKKYSFDINIYTSDNGVEGLGYVFITNPNIIIVDTTLPKYSGKDVIEFFVQNIKFRSDDVHVIILEENPRKKLNLPKNFHRINKNKQNSFDQLTDILIEKLNVSDYGRMSKLYDALGGFIMKYSNKDDILSSKISKKIRFKNIFYTAKWAILEIMIASALALIMLVFGRPKDDNIAQSRLDRKIFRTKYYPTLALSFVSALFIVINVTIFGISQFSIFRNYQLGTKALTTFVVDSTADDADFSIGDGFCDTNDSVGDGPCTLRAAIQEANVTVDDVTISFNIPGAGVHTLIPASIYPTITRSIVIDGTTEAGTDCATSTLMVELNGTNIVGGADGLKINTPSSSNIVIKGLVIQNFNGSGISLESTVAGTASISCNIIGLDSDGVTINDNVYGITISNHYNATIGGVTTSDRNIISGNSNTGIAMLYDGKATISGNYIGTDNTGLLDKGNGIGIATSYSMTGMVIGGSDAGERNVISGNTTGIVVNTPGLTIQGNYIGPGADGVTGIGNSTGISIYDDTADLDIYSNVISFNYLGIGASADGQYALYNIHIHDNLIGTDSTGDNPAGNNTGISISLPAPQDPDMQGPLSGLEIIGNTISDNNNVGIAISDYSFSWYEYTETRIENNRIGLKKNSDTALGNAIGISIGGHAPIGSINNGNLIKYNTSVGIIASNVSETSILGNTIESNAIGIIFEGTPSSTITNNSFIDNTTGMIIRDSSNQNNITNNTFCSSSGGEIDIQNSNNNIFRYNKFGSTNDTSLEITGTSIGNAIIENDFSISTEIPIDLGDDGATVNDLGDSDTGANNRQNYPYNISLVGENIEFDIDSNAADYRIEFHVPDSGSCSELSSLMCSGGIDHAGGTVVSYSLYCPGLPLGDFDIYGLAILEPTPFEYSDTSELSPLTTLNNPGPTNTPTPTETPVPTATDTPVPTSTDTPVPTATDTPEPTATNTPLPTSTNTPIPTATSTPMPTPTFTPLPTPTNTPIPSFTNTPTTESTGTPQVTSVPEATSAFIEPTSQQSLTDPSPTVENIGVKSTTTPTQTIRPTSQIPENVIENLELDLSPNDTYAIPDDSIIKTPVVKSSTLSFTQRLDDFVTDSPMIGNLLKTSISMGERIKPLSDNLNYLLSLQFIGLQTAQVGVTTLNVLALATPAIVTAFSQPKILYYALAWFWKRKSKQPWGIVYDKATGAPVAFASLVLSQEGKTVSTQATDLQGKYGFFVNKGKYQLYISHSDYLELVSDIEVAYDGEIISQDFEVIAKSRDDVNSNIRWSVYKLKRQLAKNLFILNTTIFSIGFVYTIFAITNHLTIINYVILSLYLFQFLLMIVFYFFKEKEFGQVLDVSTGLPVSGAIVRIFNEDRQIDVAITDKQGRYSFILEPGNYYLKATANGYVFPSENTPNITKNKLGNKLLKFTTQDKQRVNITVYMRKFATLNANKQVILSPFN